MQREGKPKSTEKECAEAKCTATNGKSRRVLRAHTNFMAKKPKHRKMRHRRRVTLGIDLNALIKEVQKSLVRLAKERREKGRQERAQGQDWTPEPLYGLTH